MFFLIVLTIFNAFAINHTQAQLPGVPQPVIVVNDVTAEVVDTRNWLKKSWDYLKNKTLLDDKYFYVFKAEEIEGELVEKFKEGENIWMTKKQVLASDKVFHDVKEIISLVEEGQFKFIEREFVVEEF